MVAARAERGGGQDLGPRGGLEGLDLVAVAHAGLDRDRRRVVADEVAGIDIEAADATLDAELDQAPVVAGGALAAGLPAVHPLPLSSNLPGTNWAGSGLSMRPTSAKKSSERIKGLWRPGGVARSTERCAQSGSSAGGAKNGAPGVWLAMVDSFGGCYLLL